MLREVGLLPQEFTLLQLKERVQMEMLEIQELPDKVELEIRDKMETME
jgi:hypothetical protein